jgi:putative ABC transport system permease protein
MNAWQMAWQHFYRDWRNTELRVLVLALMIAVSAVTAVGFFTDKIYRLIEQQGAELLAADFVVISAQDFPDEWLEQAQIEGLITAKTWSFPSVILHEDDTVLTAIKAVSEHYPLRGQLRYATSLDTADAITDQLPQKGEIWLESRLLHQFGIEIGDQLSIGTELFKVSGILTYEPDRGGFFNQFAPRVLMNLSDVIQTGLIGEGSRVRYRLLIAGQEQALEKYRQWLTPQLTSAQRIEDLNDAQPELRSAIERADRFLSLAALVAVILAGAAIAVAAQQFARKQVDASAIMRCLGATQGFLLRLYLYRLLLLGLLGGLLGCLLGLLAQMGLAHLLTQFLNRPELPSPSLYPLILGFMTGFITLFGFALPPLLKIHSVSPLRVLRQDITVTPPQVWQVLGLAVLAMSVLMLWQAGEWRLALIFITGTLATLALLLAVAGLLILSLKHLRESTHISWRFGLANLSRRARSSSVQLTAFGLGMMALLLLAIVRIDLLNAWQGRMSEETPNYFAVNIQPESLSDFDQFLTQSEIKHTGLFPMAVGRFVAVNGRELDVNDYDNPRAKRMLLRTFNLSSHATLPAANQVIAGEFWSAGATQELSVEQGFARLFDLKLGDELSFLVGGQSVTATITSFRTVEWESFNVNFFVLGTPDLTANLPRTYVTSFHLPNEREWSVHLVRQFPSITLFDLKALMDQVRGVIDKASLAIQYVFLFTLIAGIIVLYAAIAATHEERLYESALLRTLGATRGQILAALLAEFMTLGGLAGLLAASASGLISYVLAIYVFELSYHFNPTLWLIGIFGGMFGIGLAGLLGTYGVLKHPPLRYLRLS